MLVRKGSPLNTYVISIECRNARCMKNQMSLYLIRLNANFNDYHYSSFNHLSITQSNGYFLTYKYEIFCVKINWFPNLYETIGSLQVIDVNKSQIKRLAWTDDLKRFQPRIIITTTPFWRSRVILWSLVARDWQDNCTENKLHTVSSGPWKPHFIIR